MWTSFSKISNLMACKFTEWGIRHRVQSLLQAISQCVIITAELPREVNEEAALAGI